MSNVKFILDADEAKAVNGFLKVVDSQRKAERQFKKTNRVIDKQNKLSQGMKKHIDVSIASVGKLAAGWVSVGSAVTIATQAVQKMNEANDRAAETSKQIDFSRSSLTQIAKGPADLNRMIKEAEKTAIETGMDLVKAENLQYALETQRSGKDRAMVAALDRSIGGRSLDVMASYATARAAFKGGDEIGTAGEFINKAFTAALQTNFRGEQLMGGIPQLASLAKMNRLTDEEVMSLLAITAQTAGSVGKGATQAEGILTTMFKRGHGGKGLGVGLREMFLETRDLQGEDLQKYFGRKEGMVGFANVRDNSEWLARLIRDVDQANMLGPESVISRMVELRRGRPDRLAQEEEDRAAMRLKITELNKLQVDEAYARKRAADIRTESLERDEGAIHREIKSMVVEFLKFMGQSVSTMQAGADIVDAMADREYTRFQDRVPMGMDPEPYNEMIRTLKGIQQNTTRNQETIPNVHVE